MWILISWLLKKPADLDLHCSQRVHRNLVSNMYIVLIIGVSVWMKISVDPDQLASEEAS